MPRLAAPILVLTSNSHRMPIIRRMLPRVRKPKEASSSWPRRCGSGRSRRQEGEGLGPGRVLSGIDEHLIVGVAEAKAYATMREVGLQDPDFQQLRQQPSTTIREMVSHGETRLRFR